jgi:hypothetical protein
MSSLVAVDRLFFSALIYDVEDYRDTWKPSDSGQLSLLRILIIIHYHSLSVFSKLRAVHTCHFHHTWAQLDTRKQHTVLDFTARLIWKTVL